MRDYWHPYTDYFYFFPGVNYDEDNSHEQVDYSPLLGEMGRPEMCIGGTRDVAILASEEQPFQIIEE